SGGRYLARHGDGVADIAIRVDDVRAAFDRAVARGARPIAEPAFVSRPGIQPVLAASVQGPGDLVHTLVQTPEPEPAAPPIGPLLTVDHVAMCVPAGELGPTTQFYCDVFGFHTIFSEKIVLGDQGMDSKVVRNDSGQITFTLIEPDAARPPGQIDML